MVATAAVSKERAMTLLKKLDTDNNKKASATEIDAFLASKPTDVSNEEKDFLLALSDALSEKPEIDYDAAFSQYPSVKDTSRDVADSKKQEVDPMMILVQLIAMLLSNGGQQPFAAQNNLSGGFPSNSAAATNQNAMFGIY